MDLEDLLEPMSGDAVLQEIVSLSLSKDDSEVKQAAIPDEEVPGLYDTRFKCMKDWFLRCSWNFKLRSLNHMLLKLKDESHLEIILTTLNYRIDKLRIYTEALPNTNYIYDKKLKDHNRSLEKSFLEETFHTDIEWFAKLNPSLQIQTLIELLKLGGDALVNKFYNFAVELRRRRSKYKSDNRDEISILFGGPADNDPSEVIQHSNVSSGDSGNVLALELEKNRKIWYEAITSYKNQVLGIPEMSQSLTSKTTDGISMKSEKSSKTMDKVSIGKNRRSFSKSGGGTKRNEDFVIIDQVQMLPIWIVKKIFGYLDQKTLKVIRSVNSYWEYVVDDMANESSCRKQIDKVIKKMQKSIQIVDLDADEKLKKKTYRQSKTQKRMKELAERGAIHPKLRTTNDTKLKTASLLEKTIRDKISRFNAPTQGYETFPRNVPVNSVLLQTPSYVLNELGRCPFQPKSSGRTVVIDDKVSNAGSSTDEEKRSKKNEFY